MSLFRRIGSAFKTLFRKSYLDQELQEELDTYLEMLVKRKISEGLTPAEARRKARLEFGGMEQVKEKVREERPGSSLNTLLLDVRYALRTLRKNAGFFSVAILILAVGIGGNAALFSAIHSAFFRGMPYPDSERLVIGLKTTNGSVNGAVSAVDYFDLQELSQSFEDLAAVATFTLQHTSLGGERPELIEAAYTTWNLFPVLQVQPVSGRWFNPEDISQGRAPLTLISYGLWQRRFGGDAEVVGSTIDLDGASVTIIGVLPRGFRFLHDADVWLLIDRNGPFDTLRNSHSHQVIGRLRPGITLSQARQEADAIFAGLAQEYPDTNAGKGIWLSGLQDYLVQDIRLGLFLLLATTGLVLIIGCANVAGLLLARGDSRRSEMFVRSTLGASRGRLFRQLMTESMILALLAGILGVVTAHLLQGFLTRLLQLEDLAIELPGIDLTVLAFTAFVALTTGLVVGTVPAHRVSSVGRGEGLLSGARASRGIRSSRFRSSLVVVQVAVSAALLVGSALLLRSLSRLSSVDLGFRAEGLYTVLVQIPWREYPSLETRRQFFASLKGEIEALPGVESAGFSTKLPIVSTGQNWSLWPASEPHPPAQETFSPMVRWVSTGFFRTMGIELLRGRDFSVDDEVGGELVVVLSEGTVRAVFGDTDPIGHLVHVGGEEDEYQVIGVVADAHLNELRRAPDAAAYMSAAQTGQFRLQLAVRTASDPMAIGGAIEDLVRQKDPHVLLADPGTMERALDGHLASFRIVVLSLILFAGIALLLAATGLYGILSFHVNQRRNEVGIRLAMGATRKEVLASLLMSNMMLAAVGLVIGLGVAYPGTMLIRNLLYETPPLDPSSYLGAVGSLVLVAAVASVFPAWRAARLEVAEVLKVE